MGLKTRLEARRVTSPPETRTKGPATLLGARRHRRNADAGDGDAAGTVLQLAVLLQAGVAPARSWEHVASTGDAAAARVAASITAGASPADAIADLGTDAWREVSAAWRVASVVGAPLAECLRALAAALRDAQQAADDVRVALAEPAGTARLMGWLPLVAVALGAALGFDTFTTLFTNPLGLMCLLGGAVLIVVSQRWTARLVARARSDRTIPGLHAELIAIALSGGVSLDRARRVVDDARARGGPGAAGGPGARGGPGIPVGPAGPRGAPASATSGDERDVDAVLALSRSAGVPAVELLRATAAHARHSARVEGRLRAARLSSRLLIPLGVCTLPAFILLGVAPMLLSVMSTMSVSL